jgi:general secretion pathway protein E
MKANNAPSGTPAEGDSGHLRALAEQFGLAFLDCVSDDLIDPTLVADVPVEWSRSNRVLPVRLAGDVCMLTCDPADVSAQEYLSLVLGLDVRPVVVPVETILQSIETCYYSRDDSPTEFIRDLEGEERDAVVEVHSRSNDLLEAATEAPVTHLVNLILLAAVKRRASDIHFEPFEDRLRVRYRIDGVLYNQESPPKHLEDALVSRLKVMGHMDIAEKRLPQDGMARVRVGEREIDIRLSTVPVAEGERVVLRLLDKDSTLLPMQTLGMTDAMLGDFRELLALSNGMIVVSGPTGSGKTTTLYAALGELDSQRQNILTIEEPIEYQLPDIGQIQVKPKIGLTFARGLRHILRQDPDIVLVGETRDLETADISIRASLTGHLVFTTLHTNDAPGAVLRLCDMGVEPYLLASCLRGVLAQRLVRRLCRECRREAVPGKRLLAEVGSAGRRLQGRAMYEPAGCAKCLEGYAGRVGLFQLMSMTGDMRQAVRTGKTEELNPLALAAGMRALQDDGIDKALKGQTSLAEVAGVCAA